MNKELIEENKQKLLSEKQRIVSILSRAGKKEGKGEFPGEYKPNFPEMGDKGDENAAEVTQFEASLDLTKRLEGKLKRVEAALKRIEDGTYGKDAQGRDIPEARLRAVPEADS
ncbi:MAG: TraR/DksA family transcriptional regulator [Candidatus Doudnabacteria bacterium]|nr:TraR/DksA family transcriptional regulator [Candidatus Doudnabacteria bacterium]